MLPDTLLSGGRQRLSCVHGEKRMLTKTGNVMVARIERTHPPRSPKRAARASSQLREENPSSRRGSGKLEIVRILLIRRGCSGGRRSGRGSRNVDSALGRTGWWQFLVEGAMLRVAWHEAR